MRELRILCRVVTYDPTTNSILLVRNKGQNWWCAPGGGWDYDKETILSCAQREVYEEAGIQVEIKKLLYLQTLHIEEQDSLWIEQFWFAEPSGDTTIPQQHVDHHGIVDEARWFSRTEAEAITVYPAAIGKAFWEIIPAIRQEANRYLGHFVL